MKKIFLMSAVIYMAVILNSNAQKAVLPVDKENGKVVYEAVVNVENTAKQDIYKKAKEFLVRTLKAGDNNINLDDKDFNTLTITGVYSLPDLLVFGRHNLVDRRLSFKVNIDFKDNKYKYDIENIEHHSLVQGYGSNMSTINEPIEDMKSLNKKGIDKTNDIANDIITKLIAELEKSVKNQKKSDW